MKRFIHRFKTTSSYEQYRNNGNLLIPNVSCCEDSEKPHYNESIFYIGTNIVIPFKVGLTWEEFVNSEYNNGNFVIDGYYVMYTPLLNPDLCYNKQLVKPDDIIIPNANYDTSGGRND